MKADEARALAEFLKAAFPSMTEQQVDVYESSLLFEDAALASKAILDGVREWKFPPRYAEIVERIRVLKRASAPTPAQEEETVFARALPLWVKRWVVARYVADPRDDRPFREQYGFSDNPEAGWMPDDAWVEEAKRLTDEQVRAAANMGET